MLLLGSAPPPHVTNSSCEDHHHHHLHPSSITAFMTTMIPDDFMLLHVIHQPNMSLPFLDLVRQSPLYLKYVGMHYLRLLLLGKATMMMIMMIWISMLPMIRQVKEIIIIFVFVPLQITTAVCSCSAIAPWVTPQSRSMRCSKHFFTTKTTRTTTIRTLS